LNPGLTATKSHRIGGIPPPGQFNGIQSSWFGHILAAIEAVGACGVGRMRRWDVAVVPAGSFGSSQ